MDRLTIVGGSDRSYRRCTMATSVTVIVILVGVLFGAISLLGLRAG